MNKPPDHITSLKEMLWYLKHYEYAIFVPNGEEYLALRDLDPETWADWIAGWLTRNELPMRRIAESEAKEKIAEIQAQGGLTQLIY